MPKYNLNITLESEFVKQREKKIKRNLEFVLKKYDLSKYIFTHNIQITGFMRIPHSHPVLTLTPTYLLNKKYPLEQLLATFIHEQYHWFLNTQKNKDKLISELMDKYPNLKTELPYGSGTKFSTYQDIIICFLEYRAMRKLLGSDKATDVIKSGNH